MNNSDEVIMNAKDILDKLKRAKDIPCIIERRLKDNQDKIVYVYNQL